jgi:DNA-binding helix-hairpin-helix protein with protein kinase domain
MRSFCDLRGNEAGLGRCLGQGGEGAVYSVANRPGTVAKIYARRPDERASRKLGAMVQLGTEELTGIAAWPQDLLHDPRTGSVVGFLMPRIDGHHEIHKLYGPADRKLAFPDAGWGFLIRAARNLAAAFDAVHRHGHVIGDVNQGNVVVSRQATVRLIDCDSFQITHLGRNYPCRVGVPLFTPPELQGRKLDDLARTPEHDSFGLAVLIFHLLFMGRHPFAGRHPDRAIPVETALREGLFAFGRRATGSGIVAPPYSLRLRDLTPTVAELFERAFGREAIERGPRPSAGEWLSALESLEGSLRTCPDDPRHVHAHPDASCPWCRIENDGGPSFFFLPPGTAPGSFDLAAVWSSIQAIESPGPAAPPLERSANREPVEGLATAALRALRELVGDVALRTSGRWRRELEREQQRIDAAQDNLRRLEVQWADLCGDQRFLARKRELEQARAAYERLREVEEKEWDEVTSRYRDLKLRPFLQSFALEFARIPGLGPAELARLASRGIATAADITPEQLMSMRFIDLELVKALLLFKGVATRAFRFDPVIGVPGRESKALEDAQALRRARLVKQLQQGALELAEVRRQTLAWRDVLGRGLHTQRAELTQLRTHAVWTHVRSVPAPRGGPLRPGSAGSSAPSVGR